MITYSRLGKCGRLGNQLFQIAATLGIAEKLGQSAGFFSWDYRPYFRLPDEFFPEDIMGHRLEQAYQTTAVNHIDSRAREYLQDWNLFKDIAPQIWSWFQPSNLALEILCRHEWFAQVERPSLSIHVRRGDNAKAPNNCHPLRPTSYYRQMPFVLDGKFEAIVVFSDDIAWCRENLGDLEAFWPIYFFEGGAARKKEHEPGYRTDPFDDWIDLHAMSMCDYHVLSNSTYSWWGAFLSHDEQPIYPWPFFGSDLDYIDCGLMFPPNWYRADHGQVYS